MNSSTANSSQLRARSGWACKKRRSQTCPSVHMPLLQPLHNLSPPCNRSMQHQENLLDSHVFSYSKQRALFSTSGWRLSVFLLPSAPSFACQELRLPSFLHVTLPMPCCISELCNSKTLIVQSELDNKIRKNYKASLKDYLVSAQQKCKCFTADERRASQTALRVQTALNLFCCASSRMSNP